MSRKTVRHQAAKFLDDADIIGVGTVFASPPKISTSGDALDNSPAGARSGSVIYVEVWDSSEVRAALGGDTSGKKLVTHQLRLHLLFRSRQRKAEDAMDDHDDLLEQILARIRADRTLGTAASTDPILQAGEGDRGIHAQTGMPKEIGGGTTIVWTSIDLDAVEFVTA